MTWDKCGYRSPSSGTSGLKIKRGSKGGRTNVDIEGGYRSVGTLNFKKSKGGQKLVGQMWI